MESDVKKFLKEKGKLDAFTKERYELIKQTMKYGMKKDVWLKNYLSLDPLNKAEWVADHLIKFSELKLPLNLNSKPNRI